MANNEDKNSKKKRNNYSVSLKKTDSPIIRKFAEKQSNFSESVRYLILKFCRENGVKDISNMLSEFMYFLDDGVQSTRQNDKEKVINEMNNRDNNIEEKVSENIVDNKEEIEELIDEETIDKNSIELSNINLEQDDDDEIPECYRTK